MQDQGKRLLLAVALALGVMLLWNAIFSPKNDDQKKKAQQQTTTQTTGPSAVHATSLVGTAPDLPDTKPATESKIVLKFPSFVATFSNKGGVLRSWQLTDKRYQNDATQGELLAPDGAFEVGFTKDSTYQLPKDQDWTGKQTGERTVEYTYSTPQFDLVKDYEVDPEAYIVKLKLTVRSKLADDREVRESIAVTSYQLQDPKQDSGGSSRIASRVWQSSTLRSDGTTVQTGIKSLIDNGPRWEKDIRWTGFEHPFLLVAFAPTPVDNLSADKYTFGDPDPIGQTGRIRTDIVWKPETIFKKGSTSVERDLVAYLGPKNYNQLGHADSVAGFSTGFNQTIDLGWFGFIGKPLLWLLLKFHELVGNWGIAIVLLTIVVKIATLYWTTKSMRSMKAMAVLGPQMKALQEKYKGDKQRVQVETMALYKQHGVNPLAGCLPMLLQMPIWFALYRMLQSAGELYQQPFIPGWINDLTAADPTYVLPLLLVVTMFGQARLNPSNPDPSQKMQQRMMQYGMPLMFGVMSFWFPSGLTLYIFTNTILSAFHSLYMNKYDKKSMELSAQLKKSKEAAAAAKDADAAKAAKDANVKDADAKDAKAELVKEPEAKRRTNNPQRRKKGRR
jgi:YidC/Oxa1 family membrane protein insertase